MEHGEEERGSDPGGEIAYLLRHFPRLSATFVVNELRALEGCGVRPQLFSARPCPESLVHPRAEPLARRTRVLAHLPLRRRLLDALRVARRHPLRLATTLAFAVRAGDTELWRRLGPAVATAGTLERLGVRHVHAHFGYGSEVGMLVGLLTGVSFSFTAHARDIFVTRPRILREKLHRAAFVVTVCEYNREHLLRLAPEARSDALHVIHPFLDLDLFSPEPANEPAGVRDGPLRIASVGRLVEKKGFPILLEALADLAERNLAFRATIVGDGPGRGALAARVADLGLAGSVELAGPRDAPGVRDVLAASDVFALACVRTANGDRDATPTVLGEAMAMGLPVVSTDVSGIPEILPPAAGHVVPSGDAAALADALASLAEAGPARRSEMGRAGRALVHEHWNPARDVARLAALFERSLGHAPAAPEPPAADGGRPAPGIPGSAPSAS